MNLVDKDRILSGRRAVDTYRTAHAELHSEGWYEGIFKDHSPLLNRLLEELRILQCNSLQEFFDASEELIIQELGFASRQDFWSAFNELNKDARHYTDYDEWGNAYEAIESTAQAKELISRLNGMWH